jgi:hypothetical protein
MSGWPTREKRLMSKPLQKKDKVGEIKSRAKAIPTYQDTVQPLPREIGRKLEATSKSIRLALAPISAMVWGYDKIKDFVLTNLAEKLKDVPKERLVTPDPTLAGPALEALKYAGHSPNLRELYANLLATSIDAKTAHEAHPAFVDIIRQLTPDEAKILKYIFEKMYLPIITVRANIPKTKGGFDYFADFSDVAERTGCQFPNLTPQYLGNICRLGLAEFHRNSYISDEEMYRGLENHRVIKAIKKDVKAKLKLGASTVREYVGITQLGRQFCKACVVPKSQQSNVI